MVSVSGEASYMSVIARLEFQFALEKGKGPAPGPPAGQARERERQGSRAEFLRVQLT